MKWMHRYLISAANLTFSLILRREFRKQTHMPFNERAAEYRFVFNQITRYCPRHVLDVGTGKSALPSLIREGGFMVTAIDNIRDFWPDGMWNRHYHVLQDDIRASRLLQQFDLITCISVLEHVREHNAAMRSMFRLLRPGGHLILTFPYSEKQYIGNVYDLKGSNAPAGLPYITQAFSRAEIRHWLRENQADLVEQEYWRYFSGPFWTLGERLSPPVQVAVSELHQLTLLLLRKPVNRFLG